jgi:ParB family chromosome partitioning protein
LDLEHRSLVLKYSALRVLDPHGQARLCASLAEVGQQSPVLVVPAEGRHVLIDGYRRVAALGSLGHDLVRAAELAMDEAEALLFRHRMATAERRSALEEAWLLRELNEAFGLTQDELSRRFVRSKSWVSRRLALVRELPESLQEEVRQGRLSAQAAMKHLVPLARGNSQQAEQLGKRAAAERLSTRQVGEVVAAWRQADAPLRDRLVAHPELFLRAKAAVAAETPEPAVLERDLLQDIERIGSLARRARATVAVLQKERPTLSAREVVLVAWNAASHEVGRLHELLVFGLDHAG